MSERREPMTEWQKFALLLFAIAIVALVVVVYLQVNSTIPR